MFESILKRLKTNVNCSWCHFLYCDRSSDIKEPLTENEREAIRGGSLGFTSEKGIHGNIWCFHEVWGNTDSSKNEEFKKSRYNFCFFKKYEQGMSLKAAYTLQKRESEHKALKSQIRRTNIALLISVLALASSTFFSILNYLKLP